MEAITEIRSRTVVMPAEDIDTDQIVGAVDQVGADQGTDERGQPVGVVPGVRLAHLLSPHLDERFGLDQGRHRHGYVAQRLLAFLRGDDHLFEHA